MLGLELVVAVGLAILVATLSAGRFRLPPSLLLLAAGVLLGFIPALRTVQLPPDVVLLLFLPVLLYWESLTTPLREIRRGLRGILLVGTLLVVATAAAVAALAHALGMPWGPAWVLGAALAPTDATAVGALAGLLPRRSLINLRAESLINDGTALVVYGLVVGVTVGEEHVTVPHVTWLFLVSYVGGAVLGALVAFLGVQVRSRLDDPLADNTAIILVPFTAYLLAELVEASGVLAVVVCGLVMSQVGPRVGQARQRRQTEETWSLATWLLNSALFVLVGLEAQTAVRGLTNSDLVDALIAVLAVSVMLIVVRFVFLNVSIGLIRLLDRRPQQRLRRTTLPERVVNSLAGYRGAISLAVALSVPVTLDSGAPFPDRHVIVFVTFGVIVVTLLQGLLLPRVVRWARLPEDTSLARERQLAEATATQAALAALPRLASETGAATEVVDGLRHEYELHLQVLQANADAREERTDHAVRRAEEYTALRLALIGEKRAAVVRLRDYQHIDDTVLQQFQRRLDMEEVRLSRQEAAD
ncbi:Na+/H+ antiporter [Streptomyces aculeolatus]